MKEGLEKYFEGGQVEPENIPEVQIQHQEEHAEEQVQQEGEQTQIAFEEQAQVQEEQVLEAPQEDVIEIGGTPEPVAEPQLETVETVEKAQEAPSVNLPEGVEKLVDFMNETGGTLQDYIDLNRDYDTFDNSKLLKEYYKQTKPHLDSEDIDYLVSKRLDINEEELEDYEIRDRQIALKEDLSKAKAHLNSNKEKYYNDLKLQAKQPEVDRELLIRQEANSAFFQTETEKVFEGLKGFNFDLGDGKPTVRYKVDDSEKLKNHQSNLENVIGGFLDDEGKVKDAYAYHKALFAMQNADKIAQLFYEQGRADAIKEKSTDSKNIDFSPTLTPPSSSDKLKPGQAREIDSPTKSYGVRLKYNKFNS